MDQSSKHTNHKAWTACAAVQVTAAEVFGKGRLFEILNDPKAQSHQT
jgi:hypothetical protein